MADNQTVKDRIFLFIKNAGIKKTEFERKCNLSNGYLNAMRSGLGVEKLESVLSAYPDLNRVWLLTGEGEMLRDEKNFIENNVVGDGNAVGIGNTVGTPGHQGDESGEVARLRELLAEKERLIAEKDARLADKDKIIELLSLNSKSK